MEVIHCKDLEVDRDGELLFDNISFSFQDDSRIALVGSNGAGKSTLLRVLARLQEPLRGQVGYRKGALVEYVPQSIPRELADLPIIDALLQKIAKTRPSIEEWKAYDILTRYGFSEVMDRPLGALSGGEANRAMLARALVVDPSFVLLDEPTNHMDSEAIVAFENLLKDLKIPFCLVSHDRTLLDNITQGTIFLRDKSIYYFGLPYSEAKLKLMEEDEARHQRFQDEQKEIERLKVSANRLRGWVKTNSDIAPRYRSLKKRIAGMEEDRTFVSREKKRKVAFSGAELSVKAAIRIDSMQVVSLGGDPLYQVDNFSITPGDRVAILGRNGAGKTSLLKMIVAAKEREEEGTIRFNPQVRLGYYDQELSQLKLDAGIFAHVQDVTRAHTEVVRKELIAAGFPYLRHKDRIGNLSGGERARLQFVVLKLKSPNVLILDEPTNHIDVDGVEHLEEEIDGSDATFIMVSHDRRFISNVANRFFLIDGRQLTEIADVQEYYEFLAQHDERRRLSSTL